MILDPDKCKGEVWEQISRRFYQCSRNAKKDGYCMQHHPGEIRKRRDKRLKKWDEKWERNQRIHNAPFEHIKYLEGLLDNQCIEFKRWED